MRHLVIAVVFTVMLTASAGANEAHNRLLRLPAATRTLALATITSDSGSVCQGASSEFKGTDAKTGVAFWRVDCSNRESYLIGIANDKAGSTKVLSCAMMKALSKKDDCFIKW